MRNAMHFATALAFIAIGSCSATAQNVSHAWVQFNGQGQPIVRAVVEAAKSGITTCPKFDHATGQQSMSLRSQIAPAGFETVRVCEGDIDATMTDMSVGGISLPTPSMAPQNVAVIGDTGCRVKGRDVQNCTGYGSGDAWNFKGMAATVAAAKPDLLIHVGDMHYREYTAHCGQNCVPANIGYSWQSWKVDYFDPSASLFETAPMIPVRGNHEDCTRAWNGWFFLLDPHPITLSVWPNSCPTTGSNQNDGSNWYYTLPYIVAFQNFQVVVMDTSYIGDDYGPTPDQLAAAQYTAEFDVANSFAAAGDTLPAILATHRPIWAVASFDSHGVPSAAMTDLTLQYALGKTRAGGLINNFDMTVAGHIHLAQKLGFNDGRPTQFVFGNSGTKRDPALGQNGVLSSKTKAALARLGAPESAFYWSYDFDFGMIQPQAAAWNVSYRNIKGGQMTSFTVPY